MEIKNLLKQIWNVNHVGRYGNNVQCFVLFERYTYLWSLLSDLGFMDKNVILDKLHRLHYN